MPSKNTIQQRIDNGDTVTAWCHNAPHCNHHQVLDLAKLRDRLGPDHGAMHADLAPKLRCSVCGSKSIGLIVSPRDAKHRVDGGRKNLYARAKGE